MMAKKTCSEIGGQAVIEGVMMRGKSVMATAVRDPGGKIQVESSRFTPLKERGLIYKIPILRGLLNFITTMTDGVGTLMRATEVYGADVDMGEPSKFEKWLAKVFKVDAMKIAMGIGFLIGLTLALGLFVFLPTYLTKLIFLKIDLTGFPTFLQSFFPNITSGVIKLLFFISYLFLVSRMKDINRMFRYHGAEHKTISAFENNLELTVENVQKMRTAHDRCGSTFIIIVFLVSIIVLSILPWFDKAIYNFLLRIALLPVIVGICYELLKIFAKYDNFLTKILKAPGLLLQRMTVKEPDDSMVEVAIVAFNTVLELQEDESKLTTKFNIKISIVKARKELNDILKEKSKIDQEEISRKVDIILLDVLDKQKFSELHGISLDVAQIEKARIVAKKVAEGMPLEYAMDGKAHFMGRNFLIDNRAMIPRMDTERLFEKVMIGVAGTNLPKVLELCTGSGVLAVSLKKMKENIEITATDISLDALELARENAKLHEVDINFLESDMFNSVKGKFDVIFANPPYIPTKDIPLLNSIVKDYDPKIALDGGEDGLDFYRIIANNYRNYLNPNGVLYLEIGKDQQNSVEQLFSTEVEGVPEIIAYKDYNNPAIVRVLRIDPKIFGEKTKINVILDFSKDIKD